MRRFVIFPIAAVLTCTGIPGVQAPPSPTRAPDPFTAPRAVVTPQPSPVPRPSIPSSSASSGAPGNTGVIPAAVHAVAPALQTPPTTHAQAMPPDVPVRLLIPSIGVDAPVDPVGLQADGKPGIAGSASRTAWFAPGPRPGEDGAAIINGVLDATSGPAVFWNLNKLAIGDRIAVVDAAGQEHEFVVRTTQLYNVRGAPLREIYTGQGKELHLITCAGKWDTSLGHYDQRFVVFADLLE